MKHLILYFFLFVTCTNVYAQESKWKDLYTSHNFFVVSDLGRNGYYDQKEVAKTLGEMADIIDPSCIFALGDTHHFYGIASTQDPLWMTNYELIYNHPALMMRWFPVCGNHEYRGNTQAMIDYSKVSARWQMEARYYSKVYKTSKYSIRFVLIDTTPFISKFFNNPKLTPDAGKQDTKAQLDWLDKELTNAKEDWVVVMGHQPIYCVTQKSQDEQTDMQNSVGKILNKHNNKVTAYICGHIHCFQHLKIKNDPIDYLVNSSGSKCRDDLKKDANTTFLEGKTGFTVIGCNKNELQITFVDKEGNTLYQIKRAKKM